MGDEPPIPSPTQWVARCRRARKKIQQARTGSTHRARLSRHRERTWAALTAMHEPLRADDLRRLLSRAARHEWEESHMPPPGSEEYDALSATDKASRTTAPITRCVNTTDDDTGAPLRFLRVRYAGHIRPARMARRSRLLYGRAYTATVRRRFPTDAAAPIVDTVCTDPHCSNSERRSEETVEHLLLHCPRHADARSQLELELAHHNLALTLKNILNPPDHGGTRRYLALYHLTDTFLASIDNTRQQLGLPSLNSCPRQPGRPQRSPPLPNPVTAAQAAPPAAPAAAPLLDTG